MKNQLQYINIDYTTFSGVEYNIPLSYQLFGQELFSAPIILINHALTGNSNVSGTNGWWNKVVSDDEIINTKKFTVLSFNIPGNGYDDFFIDQYQDFTTKDIAQIFLLGLQQLNINSLDFLIGGSIGGSIGWEMLALKPDLAKTFIPIATDHITRDWLHSQCLIQKFLLESNEKPLEKARIHAMLCYRTPKSLNQRFNNQFNDERQILESEDWLRYHGTSLNERFSLKAYLLVNHLLMTINIEQNILKYILANIHMISIDSDLFFPAFEMENTYEYLRISKNNVWCHQIKSIHGHDAFLMEYDQLKRILKSIIK